ncbi:MAG: hypothetical protein KatS3mg130_0952 [Candidatus Sumerlaea sp.]|nr:MAG: hypothetical protein KatS3mg130_0952 [Candidatus Sumerlaea sp.]
MALLEEGLVIPMHEIGGETLTQGDFMPYANPRKVSPAPSSWGK